ncbi:MAG: hypothetical protein IT365_20440 [Candidatus Hydrogenedentes bacterium]|nr:hypothetical protein [Candidatus Hydrogenedentota bacterium]
MRTLRCAYSRNQRPLCHPQYDPQLTDMVLQNSPFEGGGAKRRGMFFLQRAAHGAALVLLLLAVFAGCGGAEKTDGADPKVTSLGSIEVTAKLVEILGEFPPNDLYDYAYVLKYEVMQTHRGEAPKVIYVGQYNPLKARAEAADARSGEIGGTVTAFRAGDVHRMALEVPIDDYCMVGIINKYAEQTQEPIYWAVWTNRVVQ